MICFSLVECASFKALCKSKNFLECCQFFDLKFQLANNLI